MIIIYFILYLCLDIDWVGSLFLLTCTLSVQHLGVNIGVCILNFVDINLYFTEYYFLFSYTSIAIIVTLVYIFFSRKLADYIDYPNVVSTVIGLSLAIAIEIFFFMATYQTLFMDFPDRLFISSVFVISNTISTVFIIALLYISAISQKRKQENLVLSLIREKEKERFEMAKVTIDEINIKYHDLKHMLTNKALNENDEKEIKETITNYKAFVHTNNVGLNVVIYETQLKCINLGIDLKVLLDGDYLSNFKPHHVYSLFSNLLDNAIEAVTQLEDTSKKRISLNIKKIRETIVIIIENYMLEKPQMRNGLPVSSKKDKTKHGYGLKSVKRIVDIYNGIISINTKGDTFSVKIVFPIEE